MSGVPELLAKATLLLAAGFLAAAALRQATAGTRHAVWAAVLAGLLVLPMAGLLLPALPLPLLPPVIASELSLSVGQSPDGQPEMTQRAAEEQPARLRGSSGAGALWIAAYLVGVATVLGHLAVGLWRVHRLTRQARPPAPALVPILDELNGEGIRRPTILISSRVTVPFTWGAFQPVTILPREAEGWPRNYLQQALCHELAHVERWDWLTQTFSRLICAIYWFHPLVWIASRRLTLEAERASDDRVLLDGNDVSDYAEHLVTLARRLRTRTAEPLAAVTMARQSQLPRRLQAILDSRTRRSDMTRSRLVPCTLIPLTLVLLLAPAQLVPAATDGEDDRASDPLAEYLISAVQDGNDRAISALLAAGARADSAVPGDGNALIAAAAAGDADLLTQLIATGADVDASVSGDGNALIAAAREGHLDSVRLLVESGAEIDRVVPGDENPLIQASWNGHLEVVRYLIDQGADVNVEVLANGHEWRSPLRQARREGHDDVAELLRAAGAVDAERR